MRDKNTGCIIKIKDKNTGRIYENINQCALSNNISYYLIKKHLDGGKTKISKFLNIEYYGQ